MKTVFLAAAATAVVLTATACSSSSGSDSSGANSSGAMPSGMSSGMSMPASPATGASTGGAHNTSDVEFATNMIPHHGQAIEMADLALAKATNPQVKAFARQIKAAQSPEIRKMSDWLRGWGAPVPSSSMGASMPGMSMPGQMSAADMTNLRNASGTAFDKMWVEMMIKHHTGAIDMAKTQLAKGQSTDAKALAQAIIDGQSAEIAQFRKLLPTLGA